ncbi:hypothetical protein J2Z58_001802 [Halobacillus andaensis]|nr:hypothetical protein [Halobacillus andaensis]
MFAFLFVYESSLLEIDNFLTLLYYYLEFEIIYN